MIKIFFSFLFLSLSIVNAIAADPTPEEIKAGSDFSFNFEIPLEEGNPDKGNDNGNQETWATAYGVIDGDHVFLYVESPVYYFSDFSTNYVTTDLTKGTGQGAEKQDGSYAFITDNDNNNVAWTYKGSLADFLSTGKFAIGVAAGTISSTDKSGFGSTSFELRTTTDIPIDGGISILALAGLGFGLYKRKK